MIGRLVTLSDEGEGWLTGYTRVTGVVESVVQSNQDDNPYYVVRLESPLELQEQGAATPSGFIVRRYSHCVIHCRWQGVDISAETPASVHVLLVPAGTPVPQNKEDIGNMNIRAWASCVLAEDTCT
jgi:hypothetical protein